MTKNRLRRAQRASPHLTAEQFRADERPTLINYADDFLAYDGEGAYRLIEDDKLASEVQSHLEGAEEMRPTGTRGTLKPYPFNPKTRDVSEVVGALGRKYHIEKGAMAPPCFLPGPLDYSAIDARNVISCRNGLLDVSTRLLYSASWQFFTRSALPIAYDADAEPVRWLSFLEEVLDGDPELVLLMQQMFGYLITSETRYQKIFYFRGVSNSGKSTTMRVLDALIGERNICNPSIADLAERSTLNDMSACTLAKITDMNTDDRQKLSEASSVMNRISGEDPVHIFRKFKDGLDLRLPLRFLMAGNQFPNFGEHATALSRRLLVIPFNVSFEDRADPDLSAKLVAELPGILNWALAGLDNLRSASKFIEPEASKDAKAEVLNSGDPVRSFVNDECETGPDYRALNDDIFARYQQHCQVIGVKQPLSKPKLISTLKTFKGIVPIRLGTDADDRRHGLRGLRLTDVERIPTITFKLDPFMLDLGIDRSDPLALIRDTRGRPIELRADEFED
jgi:putative DNA primase/helicase